MLFIFEIFFPSGREKEGGCVSVCVCDKQKKNVLFVIIKFNNNGKLILFFLLSPHYDRIAFAGY